MMILELTIMWKVGTMISTRKLDWAMRIFGSFWKKLIEQQNIFENNLLIARQGNQINARNKKNIMKDKQIEGKS